jgi:hypothetical protein
MASSRFVSFEAGLARVASSVVVAHGCVLHLGKQSAGLVSNPATGM